MPACGDVSLPGLLPEERPSGADVLLVCTSGGHLLQLLSLRDAWSPFSRAWVTYDKSDARSLLSDERVFFARGPGTRNLKNLLRSVPLAWRLIRALRPKVVLTTGAALAVPFAWVGRLLGVDVVYVESLTRIEEVSLTYRLVAPAADRLYVQWPELAHRRNARFAGSIFASE